MQCGRRMRMKRKTNGVLAFVHSISFRVEGSHCDANGTQLFVRYFKGSINDSMNLNSWPRTGPSPPLFLSLAPGNRNESIIFFPMASHCFISPKKIGEKIWLIIVKCSFKMDQSGGSSASKYVYAIHTHCYLFTLVIWSVNSWLAIIHRKVDPFVRIYRADDLFGKFLRFIWHSLRRTTWKKSRRKTEMINVPGIFPFFPLPSDMLSHTPGSPTQKMHFRCKFYCA